MRILSSICHVNQKLLHREAGKLITTALDSGSASKGTVQPLPSPWMGSILTEKQFRCETCNLPHTTHVYAS